MYVFTVSNFLQNDLTKEKMHIQARLLEITKEEKQKWRRAIVN